jgi:hypothetical protein
MKRTQKLTSEVHANAEGFIANGYQRLLTVEVPAGGFSWFCNACESDPDRLRPPRSRFGANFWFADDPDAPASN